MAQSSSRFLPLRCFRVVLVAAVALYCVLGVLLVAANRQSRDLRRQTRRLDVIVNGIRAQAKSLSSLALLAAASGEQAFAVRYGEALAQVRAGLDGLHDLSPTPEEKKLEIRLEGRFPRLAAVERQALRLVAAGQTEAAWTLLRGLDYEAEQHAFFADLDRLDASIKARVAGNLAIQSRYTEIAIWCILVFAPVLIVASLLLLRAAQRAFRADDQGRIALRESALTLETMLDVSSDRILLADRAGRVLSANTVCAAGFGLTPEQARGKSFFELFPADVAAGRLEWLRQVMATGLAVRFTDSRDDIVFDNVIAPLPDAAGLPRGAALFARDVTTLTRARERAESAHRATNAFLGAMSHEIRTPLNGILGMAQILEGTPLTDEQRQCLDDIENASDSLLALVNAVLELSQLEAGESEPSSTPFALASVLRTVAANFSRAALDKGLQLTTTIDEQVPEVIVGDGERLREILERLVANAVKFTETGEIQLTVHTAPDRQDASSVALRFAVHDTGIGIADTDRSRIFDTFAQGDGSVTRRYGGVGLGLAIASRLVRSLGGTLAVESQPGRGSVFSFALRFDREA